METIKSSSFLFILGVVLLLTSFALDSYIFITGAVGIIGDVKWISHLLGIALVYLGYRSKE
ncbi:MAG: hypothetical protein ACE5H4_09900 [Candidatus Thorarchaeota archaeon]